MSLHPFWILKSPVKNKPLMARNNLEERLIDFAVLIIQIVNKMPNTVAGKQLSSQLIRSGTSPALNYGEAQGAESRKDFVHKLKVVLKELRESHINLRIIHKGNILVNDEHVIYGIQESEKYLSGYRFMFCLPLLNFF